MGNSSEWLFKCLFVTLWLHDMVVMSRDCWEKKVMAGHQVASVPMTLWAMAYFCVFISSSGHAAETCSWHRRGTLQRSPSSQSAAGPAQLTSPWQCHGAGLLSFSVRRQHWGARTEQSRWAKWHERRTTWVLPQLQQVISQPPQLNQLIWKPAHINWWLKWFSSTHSIDKSRTGCNV